MGQILVSLPYICDCGCGYTNGDMFEDYFRSIETEPANIDVAMFEYAKDEYWSRRREVEGI